MAIKVVPLPHSWETMQMKSIGPGDADVFTKKGRTTNVSFKANNIRVSEDGKSIVISVSYKISEGRKDYTNLEWVGDVYIPLEYESKIIKVVDTSDFSWEGSFQGENHNWNQINVNTPNSCITDLSLKIDGKGDDDTGNAGVKAQFLVRAEVDDAS